MSVLVVYGSAHGSSKEIAERIADRIQQGMPPDSVQVLAMKEAPKEPTAQAMVVGSAIHGGKWLSESRTYLRDLKPPANLWAFSVGILAGAEKDREAAAVEKQLRHALGPDRPLRAHRQFMGKFDDADVNWFMRAMLRFVSEDMFPRGDHRDWADIEGWADEVGRQLKELAVPV